MGLGGPGGKGARPQTARPHPGVPWGHNPAYQILKAGVPAPQETSGAADIGPKSYRAGCEFSGVQILRTLAMG